MQNLFKDTRTGLVSLELTKEGRVTYGVGGKKTVFQINQYTELWPVILAGEQRLEENNNQAQTRRHWSYSDANDKWADLSSAEDVEETVQHSLDRAAIKKALNLLTFAQRKLVYNVYYQGFSMADIARKEKVAKSTITRRMNKALKQLKILLSN